MGIFYFILAWKELKIIKLKKRVFFLLTSDKSAIKNNPLMQLHSIFHKVVIKNKVKVLKFQRHRLSSFSAIKKTVTRVEVGGGGGGSVLFILIMIFVCTHKLPI